MRIDCPSCAASYEVTDGLLVGRTELRCARCGAQWAPPVERAPPAPPAPLPAEVAPAAPLVSRPAARRRAPGLALAWAASVLVVIAALGAAVVWRDQVAQAWPPSLRVYVALGLAHNPR